MSKRQTTHSNTYRFFVPPTSFQGDLVMIDDQDLARQIGVVLRLGAGDQIVLLDGIGMHYVVTLSEVGKGRVRGQIEQQAAAGGEPRLSLTLFAGLMRAERFEWLLQKGTEIGVAAFVPVLCERSVSDGAVGANKLARWQRIIREAAEQCRRGRVPLLEAPIRFDQASVRAAANGPALLLWEGQGVAAIGATLRGLPAGVPQTLGLLSGPEGGLTDAEYRQASEHTILPVTLGPRTLRAETAPFAAATIALYEFGEMDA
jgi:16S rRNA (uracil1498-N3)-methyltransferase